MSTSGAVTTYGRGPSRDKPRVGDRPARRTGSLFGPAGLDVVRARDLWHGIIWEVTARPGPVKPLLPWPKWWPVDENEAPT